MEARNSAGAISAISSANKSGVRSKRVNHGPAEKKHGKKETSVPSLLGRSWLSRESKFLYFSPTFSLSFSPFRLSLSSDGYEGSFSWNVDSRPLSKVAVSRWIICELEPLSVRVSEVSMAARARPLPTVDCGELNQKLKLYVFDGRKEYIYIYRSLFEWLVSGKEMEFVAATSWNSWFRNGEYFGIRRANNSDIRWRIRWLIRLS